MKKSLCLIGLIICLVACTEKNVPDSSKGSFAKGADISWLTEQENDGIKFYNEYGEEKECISLLRSLGMNSVRLRVWVSPQDGWCSKDDVVAKAKRASAEGQRIMIDFHYSDFFADPSRQTIPEPWKGYSFEELKVAVAEHTKEVLEALKKANVEPEWVQVGNETRNGMLWDEGRLWNDKGDIAGGWSRYAALTTAGYNAVKEIFPDAIVIVHIDNAYEENTWFFQKMRQNGGKFDMIGLSHYPMKKIWSGKDWAEMNQLAETNVKKLTSRFNCKVMISEVGTMSSNPSQAAEVMQDFVDRITAIEACAGIFYWEPQAYGKWKPANYSTYGWGPYDMGAFSNDGKPNNALKILFK
ncbi:MAG: glycosyl hydrolase 53 family protein [Paludibacteraceae bacterium]|nr:glycosyl hydrolase 53 family protein [Paludibacteraceae bacterium]